MYTLDTNVFATATFETSSLWVRIITTDFSLGSRIEGVRRCKALSCRLAPRGSLAQDAPASMVGPWRKEEKGLERRDFKTRGTAVFYDAS